MLVNCPYPSLFALLLSLGCCCLRVFGNKTWPTDSPRSQLDGQARWSDNMLQRWVGYWNKDCACCIIRRIVPWVASPQRQTALILELDPSCQSNVVQTKSSTRSSTFYRFNPLIKSQILCCPRCGHAPDSMRLQSAISSASFTSEVQRESTSLHRTSPNWSTQVHMAKYGSQSNTWQFSGGIKYHSGSPRETKVNQRRQQNTSFHLSFQLQRLPSIP